MSVFTSVTPDQLSAWLNNYSLGTLSSLQGIPVGVENTNYFVTTATGDYVLTLFERLQAHELPFYLDLMAHLAARGVACPRPVADIAGGYLGTLNGKPAAIVTKLPGTTIEQVNISQCAELGGALACMHLAGADYGVHMPDPRGAAWRTAVAPIVLPFLDHDAAQLLRSELEFQRGYSRSDLPHGAIHADLFRDNVLWDGVRLGGIVDFYFACTDALLYDVAIAINDWGIDTEYGIDNVRAAALLGAYHKMRPFSAKERRAWPVLLRAAALRFWLSRLHDRHAPRTGELIQVKDPRRFQHILERHISTPGALDV
jgi:homoserine kinase type II